MAACKMIALLSHCYMRKMINATSCGPQDNLCAEAALLEVLFCNAHNEASMFLASCRTFCVTLSQFGAFRQNLTEMSESIPQLTVMRRTPF